MAESRPRTVDAPPRIHSTTRQAARWLGWSVETFRRVVEEEAAWLRPVSVRGRGGAEYWDWQDLVALKHLIARRSQTPPPQQR